MSALRITAALRKAAARMAAEGELREIIGYGPLCRRPSRIGSAVIASDLGRLTVSRGTFDRLRRVGLHKRIEPAGSGMNEIWWEPTDQSRPLLRAIGAGRDVMILSGRPGSEGGRG